MWKPQWEGMSLRRAVSFHEGSNRVPIPSRPIIVFARLLRKESLILPPDPLLESSSWVRTSAI